ncbi:MAG: protein-disulfide reductase DsbD N-terminal domain-containing protein [Betaproteobacteria bacterium]|nr:protein-disulfide reductase DsbD N-terminal domain-containing protein [Betaproteobacteria bacterium]
MICLSLFKTYTCRLLLVSGMWGLGAAFPVAAETGGADLLEVDQAFRVSARFRDAKTIEVSYQIAEGYSLYRQRFQFSLEGESPWRLGKAQLPKGKIKQDATFGRVETYRNEVRALIPVSAAVKGGADALPPTLTLKVRSQGCADAGVCYPPLQQLLTLQVGSTESVVPRDALPTRFSAGASSAPAANPTMGDLLKKAP